jgi:hypothetical protein
VENTTPARTPNHCLGLFWQRIRTDVGGLEMFRFPSDIRPVAGRTSSSPLLAGSILAIFYQRRRDLLANMIGHFLVDFVEVLVPRFFS